MSLPESFVPFVICMGVGLPAVPFSPQMNRSQDWGQSSLGLFSKLNTSSVQHHGKQCETTCFRKVSGSH